MSRDELQSFCCLAHVHEVNGRRNGKWPLRETRCTKPFRSVTRGYHGSMNIFFTGPKPSASHALVDFGDEGTTIIPFARIVGGGMNNGRCCVKWPDGKEYDATLVFTGKGRLLEVIPGCSI